MGCESLLQTDKVEKEAGRVAFFLRGAMCWDENDRGASRSDYSDGLGG